MGTADDKLYAPCATSTNCPPGGTTPPPPPPPPSGGTPPPPPPPSTGSPTPAPGDGGVSPSPSASSGGGGDTGDNSDSGSGGSGSGSATTPATGILSSLLGKVLIGVGALAVVAAAAIGFFASRSAGQGAGVRQAKQHYRRASHSDNAVAVAAFAYPTSLEVPGVALPAGWQAAADPESGETYYYHAASGKTQWDVPSS